MDTEQIRDELTRCAVLASAGVGQVGQYWRDVLLHICTSCGELRRGCWAIRVHDAQPSIAPLLTAMRGLDTALLAVHYLYIEQSFGPSERQDLADTEADSNEEIRALLQHLAPSLLTLTFACASANPRRSALSHHGVFHGIAFPYLRELVLVGCPATAQHALLRLSPAFAPRLRRLVLPSDMLHASLADARRECLPTLECLEVNPLRPLYTVAQLCTLLRLGADMGIFVPNDADADELPGGYIDVGRRVIRVIAPYSSKDNRRLAELERFEGALEARVQPGRRAALEVCRVECDGEPAFKELARAAKEQWEEKRLEIFMTPEL